MRQRIIIGMVSVFIGFAGALFISNSSRGQVSASELQQGIAEEILRFHVLADSDSEEDQELKIQVKDHLIEYLKPILAEARNLDETKQLVNSHLDDISEESGRVIRSAGYDYGVKASLERIYFPVKTYGDCTFPAGEYEALRVEIGKAEGKNWWCVLYPNLCFVDATHAVVPEAEKQELKNVLTEEEYAEIADGAEIKVKFRLLEYLGICYTD